MDKKRELLCEVCERDYVVWFAPNALWNRVAADRWSFLCPTCFTVKADKAGIDHTAFELRVEGGSPRSVNRSEDDTQRELDAIDAQLDRNAGFVYLTWEQYNLMLATARAGLEEIDELRGFKAHVGNVLSDILAELRIPRDSTKGSLAEQVAFELLVARGVRSTLGDEGPARSGRGDNSA